MKSHDKHFWKTFLIVILESVAVGAAGIALAVLFRVPSICIVAAVVLFILGIVHACKVFKRRAAYMAEDLTREGNSLFAFLRSLVILVPVIVSEGFLLTCYIAFDMAAHGYHG